MTEDKRRRVAIVTCSDLPDLVEDERPLIGALQDLGCDAEPVVWDRSEVPWKEFDFVFVKSPWDYPSKAAAYLNWHTQVGQLTKIGNSSDAVRRSLSKADYLSELGGLGLPVIPTIPVFDSNSVASILRDNGWSVGVLKPAIGLGGNSVSLIREDTPTNDFQFEGTDVLCLQPYLSSVESQGEFSVVCIDGAPSHAVWKRPASGEFRIHEKFGGTHEALPMTEELHAFAAQFIAATGTERELIARFDAIRDDEGKLLLVEMDLFGPGLFVCHNPASVDLLARAIVTRI